MSKKKIITENNKARSQSEIISKCATGNKVKSLFFTALALTRQKEAFSAFQNFFLLVVRAICHDLRKTNK